MPSPLRSPARAYRSELEEPAAQAGGVGHVEPGTAGPIVRQHGVEFVLVHNAITVEIAGQSIRVGAWAGGGESTRDHSPVRTYAAGGECINKRPTTARRHAIAGAKLSAGPRLQDCGPKDDSVRGRLVVHHQDIGQRDIARVGDSADRKSTRLNSSHLGISYAV